MILSSPLGGSQVHQGMPRGPVSGGPRWRQGSKAKCGHSIHPRCHTGDTWIPSIGWSGSSSVVVRDGGRYGRGGGRSFQTWTVEHLLAEVDFGCRWPREAAWCWRLKRRRVLRCCCCCCCCSSWSNLISNACDANMWFPNVKNASSQKCENDAHKLNSSTAKYSCVWGELHE